jgi:hypothetical protein
MRVVMGCVVRIPNLVQPTRTGELAMKNTNTIDPATERK